MCIHPQLIESKDRNSPRHIADIYAIRAGSSRPGIRVDQFYGPNKQRAFPQLRSLLDRHDLLDRQQSSFLAATSFRIAINY